jgi:hypothetical protein
MGDQRPVGSHQRAGHALWFDVVGVGAGLGGKELGELLGVAGDDLPFAGLEGGAVADEGRGLGDHVRVLLGGKPAAAVDDQAAKRRRGRDAGGACAYRVQQPLFEELHPGKAQVLFAGEVVEDGHL